MANDQREISRILRRLVTWVLSPMTAPWSNPSKGLLRLAADEGPDVPMLIIACTWAYNVLYFEQPNYQYIRFILILFPLIVAFIGYPLGLRLNYPEAYQTTLWMYRCFALNVVFVTLWGIRLQTLNPSGNEWYANFYYAIYTTACFMMILCAGSLYIGTKGTQIQRILRVIQCVVLYIASLSIILFILGIPLLPKDGEWWNPPIHLPK